MSQVHGRARARVLTLAAAGLALGGALPLATAPPPAVAVDCPATGLVSCPGTTVPTAGYIYITHNATTGQPLGYQLFGALAMPTEWTCSAATSADGAYKVTCVPQSSNFMSWRCDILHADATSTSLTGRVRTTLDCDGSSPAEAQTATVSGIGANSHDSVVVPSNVPVTQFSCTVDGGGTLPRTPDFVAGCGDPGLVEVRP